MILTSAYTAIMDAIQRFKVVATFLFLWLLAAVFWGFLTKGFLIHHADRAPAAGLAAIIN